MMKKKIASMIGLAVFTLGVGMASAQPKKDKPADKAKPAGKGDAPAKVKNYEFDADLLEGNVVTPTGEFSAARTFAEHGSLIRVRVDFVKEIVKSAEDL